MARPRNHQKHLALAAEELVRSLARFVNLAGDAMRSGVEVNNAKKPKRVTASAAPSPGRLRQIKAMRAYWKRRSAEKAKGAR